MGDEFTELNPGVLPYDHAPILYLPAQGWTCYRCDPTDHHGSQTTVSWVGTDGGQLGRCSQCGQKFELAIPFERVPPPPEQEGWID